MYENLLLSICDIVPSYIGGSCPHTDVQAGLIIQRPTEGRNANRLVIWGDHMKETMIVTGSYSTVCDNGGDLYEDETFNQQIIIARHTHHECNDCDTVLA